GVVTGGFAVDGRGVFGALELRRDRFGLCFGFLLGAVAGIEAFTGDRGFWELGFEAAAHAGVIDVLQFVFVLADELVAGEEEDVIAAGGGIGEERGVLALADGDQVEAAFVQEGVGGRTDLAAAFAAGGLPLIDVGDPV